MAGMREVAKKSGVSLSTVSTVLSNNGKFVSEEIKEKVYKAADELNYVLPERCKKNDKIIAVILPSVSSAFFAGLLNEIENEVAKAGYVLIVGNSNFNFEKEKKIIKMLKKQTLCGIIIDTTCPENMEEDYYNYIKKSFVDKKIPVVILERQVKGYGFSSVYADHEKNAFIATESLIKVGNKKIGHIAGNFSNSISLMRLRGYKRALEKYGIEYNIDLVAEGDYTPYSGFIKAKELLVRNRNLTAIFAANDQMAVGAMKSVLREGRIIPDEFAIVGIDNISISTLVSPSLTTIDVPTDKMGRIAVDMVLNDKEKHVELTCELIERKSTNKMAITEWNLRGW